MSQKHDLIVFARDETLRPRGTFKITAAMAILKLNAVGQWAMTIDGKHPLSKLVKKGWGIIVFDGEDYQFSGPINDIQREVKGASQDLLLKGVTDIHVLADRIVYPDPAQVPSLQATDYWAQKAPAETLIVNLVNAQCGPSALVERRSTGLQTAVSQGRGPITSIKARLTPVLTEAQALATVGNLAFDVIQPTNSVTRELVFRAPRDKSRSVRFSPRTGLGDFQSSETAPTANTVIVGGQGTGAARTLIEANEADTGWSRRIETFQDRRDTNDVDELNKASAETLANNRSTEGVSFTITETPLYKFGNHYLLGDIVTIDIPGVQDGITDKVTSVEIDWTDSTRDLTVIVGEDNEDAKTKRDKLILEKIRRLEAQ